jgi:[ribosomal protein S5]-alanine N-acetyltransferase
MNFCITTLRLQLTPVSEQDTEELHQIWIQPEVRKYLCDDLVVPFSKVQQLVSESLTAFCTHQYGIWVARLIGESAIVGFTGYWPFFDPPEVQLIYGLSRNYWGHGLATEMAHALLVYGFQTYGFTTITASANVPNQASIAVMKRLGMTFEKQIIVDGQDLVFYKIGQPDKNEAP